MSTPLGATAWEAYREQELALITPILARLGFELEDVQVHIGGERAIISGNKLVLLGRRLTDGARVIIKASSHPAGKKELLHARTCQSLLNDIHFAHKIFLSPTELLWHEEANAIIAITEFIEQTQPFLDRSLEEQFFLALKTFEMQESAHAATYEHERMIRGTFGLWTTDTYLKAFHGYYEAVNKLPPEFSEVKAAIQEAEMVLQAHWQRIEQYLGFLTHTDFVPHNIRTVGRDIYLLDHSALRFGNKYDGWARFLNFMLLYHRKLEQALVTYVRDNRSPEESETLRLMRIFRLGELIAYYVNRLPKTAGHLHELDKARVFFWTEALQALLKNEDLSQERIKAYQNERDQLRSEEEKRRQQGLH